MERNFSTNSNRSYYNSAYVYKRHSQNTNINVLEFYEVNVRFRSIGDHGKVTKHLKFQK